MGKFELAPATDVQLDPTRDNVIRPMTKQKTAISYPPYEGGGESVSQSVLKDKAFSALLDQNPRLELRPENGSPDN
jgi:hypothetical protein